MAMKRNAAAAAKPATEQEPKKPASRKKPAAKPKKEVQEPVEVEQEQAPLPDEPPETGQPDTGALEPAPSRAIGKPRSTMVKLYDDIENTFVAEFGVLPKIKASNGNCIDGDNNLLGDSIDVQMLSWNRQFVVGPCANEAPSELVKYSYERDEFADGSGSLNEYVQELKAEGWVNAAIKEYFEVVCVLIDSTKPSDLVGEMIQLQLSPTSVKSFDGFRLQTAFKIARGLLPENAAEEVTVTTEVVSNRGNTWTKFNFKPKLQG